MNDVKDLLKSIEDAWKKQEVELNNLLVDIQHKKLVIQSLKQSYQGIKDTLETGRLSLDSAIKDVNPVQNLIEDEFWTRYANFDKNMSYPQRIRFMIHAENKFLHKKEMAKILYALDKSHTESEHEKKIEGALSKVRTTEFNAICYHVNNNLANSFWGREHYLDTDGKVMKQHMYNEQYLFKRN